MVNFINRNERVRSQVALTTNKEESSLLSPSSLFMESIMDSQSTEFYCYLYLDPSKPGRYTYNDYVTFLFQPMYVGKGKSHRKTDHLRKCMHYDSMFYRRLRKLVQIYDMRDYVIKLHTGCTEYKTLSCVEPFWISLIGKRIERNGPLFNVTDGGGGCVGYKHDAAFIEKLKQPRSKEWKQNIKEALTGKKHTEKRKENNSNSQKGKHDGSRNARALSFIAFGPDEQRYESDCIKTFCKEHQLHRALFSSALRTGKSHKGFHGFIVGSTKERK